MKVQIFHAANLRDSLFYKPTEAAQAFGRGEYYLAGTVKADDLEHAWELSQNDFITETPAKWNGIFPQRSSCVGDIFVTDNGSFIVGNVGFEEIEDMPKTADHSFNPYLEEYLAEAAK